MHDAVRGTLAAIERRDWGEVKRLLHPYLQWTRDDGRIVRGRKNVLAELSATPLIEPPEHYELRDGQVYRWIERQHLS